MRENSADAVSPILERTRAAARTWAAHPVGRRLTVIRRARQLIAAEAADLAATCGFLRPPADTLVAEILPIAEAARYLEREAVALLAPRRLGRRGRPAWLAGVSAEVRREPYGVILVLAPANYPLFLPGTHILQALAAGNGVCAKPAVGCAAPLRAFAALLLRAGLPPGVLAILDESVATGEAASHAGFDHIVLTGSADTGKRVLAAAAERLTPCTMELSGDDPVFVLAGADLALATRCIAYGVRLNGGATCIAPRRVFAAQEAVPELEQRLTQLGAVTVPVISVRDADEALTLAARSGHALGAGIFGPANQAHALAVRVDAGCVVINDLIVPTADPRLPFGGRKHSGFGVTRGAEGLLEMTMVKTVSIRRGRFRPHLQQPHRSDAALFRGLIAALHGAGRTRLTGLAALARHMLLRPG